MYCWIYQNQALGFCKKKILDNEPTKACTEWPNLLKFCMIKLNMRPVDFWQLTYAEFFPLFEHFNIEVEQPMSKEDYAELEAQWIGGNVGNS